MRRAAATLPAVLAVLAFAATYPGPRAALDGSWTGGFANGANGPVFAATIHQGDLVIGGDFNSVGGVSANHVARWDGASWHALGSGVDGPVRALLVHQGVLIVGGEFGQAGPFGADNVARWNGSSWSTLGSGVDGVVYALEEFNGVVAAGAFFQAGGTPVSRIARWNGSTWVALGSGLDNTGLSLHADGSTLYAGGFFSSAGGQTAPGIASWNGSAWSGLGDGVANTFPNPHSVEAIVGFDGEIVAAGRFLTAGGDPANHIAAWTGTSWHPLGDGVTGGASPVGAFAATVFRGELVAAGRFTTAGAAAASRIATWDGTTWAPLQQGLNSDAYALTTFGTMLFAGGDFTIAGVFSSNRVGRWLAPPAPAGAVPDGRFVPGIELTLRKLVVPAFAALDWGPSCNGSDVDYAVYAGTLDDFTSHLPVVCSTGGSTTHAFAIGADAYYLVVPLSLDFEGSYGFASDGNDRPASPAACALQQFDICP